MIQKTLLPTSDFLALTEYVKKHVIVRGIQETIYTRGADEDPKMSANSWLLDFRRMFLETNGAVLISKIFWNIYEKEFPFQIATIELGSVPLLWALLLEGKARWYETSGLIVRHARKKSGLWNILEGTPNGQKLIVVDDLINSGSTLFQALEVLRGHDATPSEVFALLSFKNPTFEKNYLSQSNNPPFSYLLELSDVDLVNQNTEENKLTRLIPEKTRLLSMTHPNRVLVVPKSSPLVDKTQIYVAGEGGTIYCLDRDTLLVNWEFSMTPTERMKNILSSPKDVGDAITFWAYDGSLYCLDKKTGKQVFHCSPGDWIGSSPDYSSKLNLIFIGLELFGSKGWAVAAIDSKTGEKIWEYLVDDFVHGSPCYIEKFNCVVCGTNCGKMLCLEADTGKLLWDYQTEWAIKGGVGFMEHNDSIIFGSFDYSLYSLDVPSGELNWKFTTLHLVYSTPCIMGDQIFFGSIDKYFYHLDADGKCLSKFKTGGRIFTDAIVYKEPYILFISNDMRIYFYNWKEKQVTMFIQHGERITTRVHWEGDYLYVHDFMNRFYLMDMSKTTYKKAGAK